MKKILGIYNNPDRRWSADLPSLAAVRRGLIKAIIPIFLGLFIGSAQAQWLGPTWETNIVSPS